MVMLITRVNEIAKREGFLIEVFGRTAKRKKRPYLNKTNGLLGDYDFKRKLKDSKTVSDWKKERFEPTYPGFSCNVLLGNGRTAIGHTSLKTVRASYPVPPP